MDWLDFPPLSALRALAALAETGSTQKAGARLNVSHAAISQHLRQLEDHTGLSLIDRSGRTLALTPDGAELADSVIDGFEAMSRTLAQLTGKDDARPLTITTTPAFASAWLMHRLPDFQRQHPGLSLMLDPTPQIKDLTAGGIDVAIRHGSGEWDGLTSELLVDTAIAIVASPDLVGEGTGLTDPKDLTGYPWLQELGTSEASTFLKRHGADLDVSRGITSMPGNMMLDAARNGQGVAVIARAFVEADVQAGRLRLLHEDTRFRGYYIVYRADRLRPAARAFVTWLRKQGKSVENRA